MEEELNRQRQPDEDQVNESDSVLQELEERRRLSEELHAIEQELTNISPLDQSVDATALLREIEEERSRLESELRAVEAELHRKQSPFVHATGAGTPRAQAASPAGYELQSLETAAAVRAELSEQRRLEEEFELLQAELATKRGKLETISRGATSSRLNEREDLSATVSNTAGPGSAAQRRSRDLSNLTQVADPNDASTLHDDIIIMPPVHSAAPAATAPASVRSPAAQRSSSLQSLVQPSHTSTNNSEVLSKVSAGSSSRQSPPSSRPLSTHAAAQPLDTPSSNFLNKRASLNSIPTISDPTCPLTTSLGPIRASHARASSIFSSVTPTEATELTVSLADYQHVHDQLRALQTEHESQVYLLQREVSLVAAERDTLARQNTALSGESTGYYFIL